VSTSTSSDTCDLVLWRRLELSLSLKRRKSINSEEVCFSWCFLSRVLHPCVCKNFNQYWRAQNLVGIVQQTSTNYDQQLSTTTNYYHPTTTTATRPLLYYISSYQSLPLQVVLPALVPSNSYATVTHSLLHIIIHYLLNKRTLHTKYRDECWHICHQFEGGKWKLEILVMGHLQRLCSCLWTTPRNND
jgi:hypothetical protein